MVWCSSSRSDDEHHTLPQHPTIEVIDTSREKLYTVPLVEADPTVSVLGFCPGTISTKGELKMGGDILKGDDPKKKKKGGKKKAAPKKAAKKKAAKKK